MAEELEAEALESDSVVICGNLEADKRDHSVPRTCHLVCSRIRLAEDLFPAGEDRDIILAVSLFKSGKKVLRSSPISVSAEEQEATLNVTFSFQYLHHLKGARELSSIRIMLQRRGKKQHKLVAQAVVNLALVLQVGKFEEWVRMAEAPGKAELAQLEISVATYTDDVETPEHALAWEEHLRQPEVWSEEEESLGSDTDGGDDSNESLEADQVFESTEVLSEQIRKSQQQHQQHQQAESIPPARKEESKGHRMGITRVSKLLSAVHIGGGHKASADDSAAEPSQETLNRLQEFDLSEESTADDITASPGSNYGTHKRSHSWGAGIQQPERRLPCIKKSPRYASGGDGIPKGDTVVLVDGSKKAGRRFLSLAAGSESSLFSHVLSVKKASDIEHVLQEIFQRFDSKRGAEILPQKIVLVGGDAFLNDVLRGFVHCMALKSRAWCMDLIRFFVIPLGKQIDIARHIAAVDSTYNTVFFSGDWEDFIRSKTAAPTVLADMSARVESYVERAHQQLRFELGEAFLTQRSGDGDATTTTKVPFVQGIQLGSVNVALLMDDKEKLKREEPDGEIELHLDYWASRKRADAKESQQNARGSFAFLGVSRLRSLCLAWRLEDAHMPSPSSLSMLMQFRDRKRGFVKATVAKAGKKLEGDRRLQTTTARVTKLVCTPAVDGCSVAIDGREWPEVKFLSLLPTWGTHVKFFPVSVFSGGDQL